MMQRRQYHTDCMKLNRDKLEELLSGCILDAKKENLIALIVVDDFVMAEIQGGKG